MKSHLRYTFFFLLSIFLFSCSTSSSTDSDMIAGSDTAVVQTKNTKAQEVFYSIPSPVETISLIKASGVKYSASYLNPIENVSNYTTVTSKALNLGVYGSDLSFTSMFDQTQESMLYLRCTNKLAAGLGITGAFNETTADRLESNMQNRDSLLSIISESYWTTDAYLKDNGQPGVSALIIAGGWIEGLYIGTQIATLTNNKGIITRIAEQKLSLENLIALLDSYKLDNAGIIALIPALNELQELFNQIPITAEETKIDTDKKNNITTFDNNSHFSMPPEQLAKIAEKVKYLRSKIIQ